MTKNASLVDKNILLRSRVNKTKEKGKKYMDMKYKNENGITIIALVVTVVVLLILAGITLRALTDDFGIIGEAEDARDETKIALEMELLRNAAAQALSKNIYGQIEEDDFREALEDQKGKEELSFKMIEDVFEDEKQENFIYEDIYVVKFEKSGRKYEVDTIGNVTEAKAPGNPDSNGIFTRLSTIDAEEASATNPKIPKGFKPIDQGDAKWGDGTTPPTEEALNEGLVIQDKKGNEYVWVPVKDFSQFTREAGYSSGAPQSNGFTTEGMAIDKYYEPASDGITVDITADEDTQEVQKMYKSVKENGGFYIGRYETGFEGTTAKSTHTTYPTYTQAEVDEETKKLVIKPNMQIYNHVPWGADMTDISAVNKGTKAKPAYVIGAVELARNFDDINGYIGVTSTLCYSVQWDAILKWMKDIKNTNVTGSPLYVQNSLGMGWYKNNYSTGNPTSKTGIAVDSKVSNRVKNIYDMAGNVYEWTMETLDYTFRVSRGGFRTSNGSSVPVSLRANTDQARTDAFFGMRIALYL